MRAARLAAALCTVALAASAAAHASPVERGHRLYGRYCISCHGANGAGVLAPGARSGAGPLRTQTQQRGIGPSLRGVGALAADFYLRTGYMPLPRIGVQPRRSRVLLTNPQIEALVAYVASLGKGPAIPTPQPQRGSVSVGMSSFTEHCAGCHQIAAEGGYVTGQVAPPLAGATPRQIAEAVRIGPSVMPRFSARAIGGYELDSLVAYVDYAKHPDDRGGWAIGRVGPVPEGLVTWFLAVAVLLAVCIAIGSRTKARRG